MYERHFAKSLAPCQIISAVIQNQRQAPTGLWYQPGVALKCTLNGNIAFGQWYLFVNKNSRHWHLLIVQIIHFCSFIPMNVEIMLLSSLKKCGWTLIAIFSHFKFDHKYKLRKDYLSHTILQTITGYRSMLTQHQMQMLISALHC